MKAKGGKGFHKNHQITSLHVGRPFPTRFIDFDSKYLIWKETGWNSIGGSYLRKQKKQSQPDPVFALWQLNIDFFFGEYIYYFSM